MIHKYPGRRHSLSKGIGSSCPGDAEAVVLETHQVLLTAISLPRSRIQICPASLRLLADLGPSATSPPKNPDGLGESEVVVLDSTKTPNNRLPLQVQNPNLPGEYGC
ncbi:hypothetical protein N7454_009122 [Penicillium verhagenii]|nr:hypothetical protein N7454_009122 [Penicillium verhagenii]